MFVQLTCAIVDADAANRQELASFLARFGIPVVAQLNGPDGLTSLLGRPEAPQLVIVNLDPNAPAALRAIGSLPRLHPTTSFFMMSQLMDANLLMEAMHLGVKEFIPLPMSEEKFTAAIERVSQTHGAGKKARVVHVVPTVGGCGSTTIACNVAASLAKLGKTVLVDMDLMRGGVASYFDTRPRFTIADVMEAADKLDKTLLDNALAIHAASGVAVLARPDLPEDTQRVTGPGVSRLLGLLGRLFDFVVVDSVMSIDPIYAATIASADVNLLTMQLNVPSAKNAERFVGAMRRMGVEGTKIRIAVNRYVKKGNDIEPEEVERALGLKIAWTVPNDFKTAIAAINFGEPVVIRAPRAEISTSLVTLAHGLSGRAGTKAHATQRPPEHPPMGLFSSRNSSAAAADPVPTMPGVTPGPASAPALAGAAVAAVPTTRMSAPVATAAAPPTAVLTERQVYLNQLKVRIHQKLVERLDVQNLRTLPADTVRAEVRLLVRELCQSEKGLITSQDQERLMDDVMDETFGLGPLETLLKDPTISDIMVNRCDRIYVERKGRIELVDTRFRDNPHLRQIIDRIVGQVGRRVDETSPMVDARLSDGSRVNAIIPPLALDGPAMSIRRFGSKPMQLEDLIRHGAFPAAVMDFLAAAVQSRCNVLISGGTGSGKTTLLNCLSRYIPADERVITIEDAAELQLQQPHVVRLETRPPNVEGKGEIGQRDLVKNCLRMRPDRIIIGECRGAEALDMLQAMNTGHEGSMTTVHANNTRDALGRIEVMVAMAGYDIPAKAMRTQIASAIQIVIQARRMTGGRRKVVSVSEISGMEGENVQMHDLFSFEQAGVDTEGHSVGRFVCTGIRPRCAERIEHRGIRLPSDLFLRRVIEA